MGLGSTAKKLQKIADTAEELYGRLNELRTEVHALRETVSTTSERVERLETQADEQRALLEAVAEAHDIDVEGVIADAHIEEAESEPDDVGDSMSGGGDEPEEA